MRPVFETGPERAALDAVEAPKRREIQVQGLLLRVNAPKDFVAVLNVDVGSLARVEIVLALLYDAVAVGDALGPVG